MNHQQLFEQQFITLNEVKHRAPSCFTSMVSDSASDKYTFIYTPDVIRDLQSIGWNPIDAYQVTPKKEQNIGYQKHFIKLRNSNYFIGHKDDIQIVPELLFINSYDAKCSCKFYISLFRVVSQTSMIIKTDELLDNEGREKMKLSHKGEKLHSYYALQQSFDTDISTVVELMNKMSSIILTLNEQKQFARECCRARWDYTYQLLNTKSLLDRWRECDEKDDLLTVSYLLQEKMIKGGWTGAGGRAIKPIKDPNRAFNINAKLFQIIENFYLQTKLRSK